MFGAAKFLLTLAPLVGATYVPLSGHHSVTGSLPVAVGAGSKVSLSGGTLLLSGTMGTRSEVSMTGAFSVGHAASLAWELPRPRSIVINGYSETVARPIYQFSVRPNSSRIVWKHGNAVTRFTWSSPPANTVIHVVERLHLSVHTNLGAFHSTAPFPVRGVPHSDARYLKITPLLHLFHRGQGLAHGLSRGAHSEQAVVESVANWVASHLRYDPAHMNGPFEAGWVLQHRSTTCRGYVGAMAALLRYLHIPSQVVYGWVSAQPINVSGPNGSASTITWGSGSGQLHAWMNIYFPGSGWVPFDPQHEKFFVDTRHFAFSTRIDQRMPQVGVWNAVPADGRSATGRSFADGYPAIAPGDGILSKVSVHNVDSFHAEMDGVRHDVNGVLLLSR